MARNQVCGRTGKLSTARRKKLPGKVFGLPRERKYPITSVSHAENAKARATQQHEKGNLTFRQYLQITQRANAYIRKCKGTNGAVSEKEQKRRLCAALKGK